MKTVYVNVQDMSAARDARRALQATMLQKYASPLICFTLNIAGPIKRDEAIDRAFAEGVLRIEEQLAFRHARVLDVRKKEAPTGSECVWAVDCDARSLKAWMRAIESENDLGRLFDIDVITEKGEKLSRGDARKCLLCDSDAFVCARSRAHSREALFNRTHQIITEYFDRKYARRLAMLAQRALIYETCVTPKPGLVDCENSGAHTDMNLFTMIDSACTVRPFFERCADVGIDCRDDPAAAFARISYAGVRAEADMLRECGTNTHKGALFLIGILVCAAAMVGEGGGTDDILSAAARIAAHSLAQLTSLREPATGGEAQYLQYGYMGVRGEAAAGYPTVKNIGLPALTEARSRGLNTNDAALYALLRLIANVRDSNILRRGGMDALTEAMRDAARLSETDFSSDDLRAMNERFVQMNISPGGSADLLAVTFFLESIQTGDACGL